MVAGVGVATGTAMRWRPSGFGGVCAGVRAAKAINKTDRAKQLLFIKQIAKSLISSPCGDLALDSPMALKLSIPFPKRLPLCNRTS
jgi:hypothetical protein